MNLQALVELGVDKNSAVVFPAPLMSTIQELGAFLSRETNAVANLPTGPAAPVSPAPIPPAAKNGDVVRAL